MWSMNVKKGMSCSALCTLLFPIRLIQSLSSGHSQRPRAWLVPDINSRVASVNRMIFTADDHLFHFICQCRRDGCPKGPMAKWIMIITMAGIMAAITQGLIMCCIRMLAGECLLQFLAMLLVECFFSTECFLFQAACY